jgi:hypothetical protein
MTYTFKRSWNVWMALKNQYVVTDRLGNWAMCVDCSLSISNIEFDGSITVSMGTGSIKSASIVSSITSTANMIFQFSTTGPFNGNWSYAFSTTNLDAINVPNVLTITPQMINSIGVSYAIDSKVQFTGGASVQTTNAGATFDISGSGSYSNPVNMQPQTTYTWPTFSSDSTVRFIPYMRSSVWLQIQIFGYSIPTSVTVNTENIVGFNADLLTSPKGQCQTNQLYVSSVSSVKNSAYFGSGAPQIMYQNTDSGAAPQCLKVPLSKPTTDEIALLRNVGGDFCTSYINYHPPVSVVNLGVTTLTTPTTVTTSATTFITSTPTITVSSTRRFTITMQTVVPSTVYVYTQGSQTLNPNLKRSLQTPTPAMLAPAALDKRAASTPAMVSGWDNTKISFACSQVATGTSYTSVYTSTTTAYSGTVTQTNTITANRQAAIQTQTQWTYQSSIATTVTNTAGVTTVTTATGCPLQTQASCFYIIGHGSPDIEGQKLRIYGGDATFQTTRDNPKGDVFRLSSNGILMSMRPGDDIGSQKRYYLGGGYNRGWMAFTTQISGATGFCMKGDCVTKSLTCTDGANNFLAVAQHNYELDWYYSFIEPYPWMPQWGQVAYTTSLPVWFTYEDVDCPCSY